MNSRRSVMLRFGALFFGPLLAIPMLFFGGGDGAVVFGFGLYAGLLLGLGYFAAITLANRSAARVALAVALAVGMFLVHLVVGVGGCTFVLAVHG